MQKYLLNLCLFKNSIKKEMVQKDVKTLTNDQSSSNIFSEKNIENASHDVQAISG